MEQAPLSKAQQLSLARLADWVVADIVHSARARRQRERRRMLELLAVAQKRSDLDENFETIVLDLLRRIYPEAIVSIRTALDDQLMLEGGTAVPIDQIEHGLWEDGDYFDYLIEQFNHLDPVAPRVVRVVAAHCASRPSPKYLVVGSKDFRTVFDDVDSSLVHMAAQMLNRGWHNLALREALSAKDNFLRGITHQLRTPIHGILGSVELLAEELGTRGMRCSSASSRRGSTASSLNGEHKDPNTYIDTIRSSARDLISTVNSLINLNRWTDIAQSERIVAPHHINEIESVLLSDVLQLNLDHYSRRPSIMFKHHLPEGLDTLTLDMRLFVDCIQPLVTNAIQATPGGIVSVTTTVPDDCESLIVDVEDTGRGLDSDHYQTIFKAYEKIDPHTTGAGLGLTLATKLAGIMNGNVTLVKSEIGKGSHFRATFALPADVCTMLPSQERMKNAFPSSLTFNTPALADSASLSNFFVRYLLQRGHSNFTDSDGSVTIFDYSIESQYQTPPHVQSAKAAICLIPDSAHHPLMNDDQQIKRDENVIYVKGPFLSNILEQAWSEAHGICVELEASKHVPRSEASLEVSDRDSAHTPASDDTQGAVTPLSSESPTSGPIMPLATEVPTEPLQRLHIETYSSLPVKQLTKPTTLIVDDNAVNLRFLAMYCRRRDIPHHTAVDGLKAVETFTLHQTAAFAPDSVNSDTEPIRLILMDLQMPNCDGVEATRQIRQLEQANGWPRATIVIVTGQDSLNDRLLSKEAGADDFFVKPVGPKVLDRGLKDWFPETKL